MANLYEPNFGSDEWKLAFCDHKNGNVLYTWKCDLCNLSGGANTSFKVE